MKENRRINRITKRFPLLLLLIFMTSMLGTGCFGQNPPRSSIGLLNLQKVLVELELDAQFEEKLRAKDQTLSRRVEERRQRYENMLVSRREMMSEELTDEERRELVRFETQANQQLQELILNSQQELQQYQQRLVRSLHDNLRPIVREIADEMELDMVMLRGDLFFMVNEELDITDTLIEHIRRRPELLEALRPSVDDDDS